MDRTTQIPTFARSLREFFNSGQLPASADQTGNDDVLYMLLDEQGALIEAAGTRAWFWEPANCAELMYRWQPGLELIESSRGAAMFVPKIPLHALTKF